LVNTGRCSATSFSEEEISFLGGGGLSVLNASATRCYIYAVRRRFRSLGVLGVVVLLVSGCGTAHGTNSTGANVYPSLERADSELGIANRDAGPAQSPLTAQRFTALTKTLGSGSAAQTKAVTSVRQTAFADRNRAARAHAAQRDANRAARMLAVIDAEATAGNNLRRGALAGALANIAGDDATRWKTLAEEAAVYAQIAPALTAEAAAERAWARLDKKGAFASQSVAKAAYRRDIGKALAPGNRLLLRDYVLQRSARRASRNLANDLVSLHFALRNYPDARLTARRLVRDDPNGYLAESLTRRN
jgi:hypothetical protein